MPILHNDTIGQFHLVSGDSSYIIVLHESGLPLQAYYGRRLADGDYRHLIRTGMRAFSPTLHAEFPHASRDTLPLECPTFGSGDFRTPLLEIQQPSGSSVVDLRYRGAAILPGKPAIPQLPASYVAHDDEADTLTITLEDSIAGVRVEMLYTAFHHLGVIAKSLRITNISGVPFTITKAASSVLAFPDATLEAISLPGAWARERAVQRHPLHQGRLLIESRRGASSHQHNPAVALVRPDTTEHHGDAFGSCFVYSGNFQIELAVDQFHQLREVIGIHPEQFSWQLAAGATYYTPEVLHAFSPRGLNGMSQLFHQVIRDRVCRGVHRDAHRPILVNNWEATYFDFNEKKLLELASTAATCGIELFVLDDGWFGERNDDTTSLGDWTVQKKKFPEGLRPFGEALEQKGLQFGLWVEPEMVSRRSVLFEQHPEWCLSVPGRERSESRNQLVLNMALSAVVDHLYETLSEILRSAPIGYIKWDMNRHLTEVYAASHPPDRQGEIRHRYVLGVYDLLERLTQEFPSVLFEGCSGGGGRFDAGMLYYTPQIWTSDNTDGVARLQIQHGTSLFYPPSTMGAHVSAVPNHQVGRTTSLAFRGHIAMAGVFGYELDLTRLSPEELQEITHQVHHYKGLRSLIQSGTFSRLRSPFQGNDTAWQIHSPSGDAVLVIYARILAIANERHDSLRLVGLLPDARYHWQGTNQHFGGDELLYQGIPLPSCHHDFVSHLMLLTRLE